MQILKIIQRLLGFVVSFYFFKGLLGKLNDGDGLKAGAVTLVWLILLSITSGLVEFN